MKIDYLADHERFIPEIAKWFYREWRTFYTDKLIDDVTAAISERTNKDRIPLALVAFEGTTLVGTICLKAYDMDTRLDLTPWLAGLYVAESWRGRGVGTALVGAIERKAKDLGIGRIYLYTPSAGPFYVRLGWQVEEVTEYHSIAVTIMKKEMKL